MMSIHGPSTEMLRRHKQRSIWTEQLHLNEFGWGFCMGWGTGALTGIVLTLLMYLYFPDC